MKKIIAISVCFLIYLFTFSVNAQTLSIDQQKKVNNIFSKGDIVHFKFPVASSQEVAPISKEISIEKMQGTMVFAHATKEQFSKFIMRNYPYTVESYSKVPTKTKAAKPKTTTK